MSFSNKLKTATSVVKFFDTGDAFTLGKKAYMAMFARNANPYKEEAARRVWDKGWQFEMERLGTLFARWRAEDKGVRA